MKGRRALPTAEALTGQKPRQRLPQPLPKTLTEGKVLPDNLFHYFIFCPDFIGQVIGDSHFLQGIRGFTLRQLIDLADLILQRFRIDLQRILKVVSVALHALVDVGKNTPGIIVELFDSG